MDRIVLDPNVLAGKPVIRGTRLPVDFIVGLLAERWTEADIQCNDPGVTHEDVAACLHYAAEVLQSKRGNECTRSTGKTAHACASWPTRTFLETR